MGIRQQSIRIVWHSHFLSPTWLSPHHVIRYGPHEHKYYCSTGPRRHRLSNNYLKTTTTSSSHVIIRLHRRRRLWMIGLCNQPRQFFFIMCSQVITGGSYIYMISRSFFSQGTFLTRVWSGSPLGKLGKFKLLSRV